MSKMSGCSHSKATTKDTKNTKKSNSLCFLSSCSLWPLWLVSFCWLASALPARADDHVDYYDRAAKKDVSLAGTIQEDSPAGIVFQPNSGSKKTIAASDITDAEYEVARKLNLDYRSAVNSEKESKTGSRENTPQEALAQALKKYQDLLPKLTEAKAKRQVEFKIAKLLALQAEDDLSRDKAVEKLVQFKKEHPDCWQVSACAKLLARLQIEKDDLPGAQKTYADLAALPKISKEIKDECEILTAQLLVKAKRYAEAEKKLQSLAAGLAPDDPQSVRIQISLAECLAASGKPEKVAEAVKKLDDIIGKAADAETKALAYNVKGDCYRLAGKPEEALWAYLWVEVVYHQDKKEEAKALYYLYKIFKDRKDEAKANQFKEKLEKDKRFAGLEYQRMVSSEK